MDYYVCPLPVELPPGSLHAEILNKTLTNNLNSTLKCSHTIILHLSLGYKDDLTYANQ